ncbi:MAG: Na+/H+ antiporter subunit G [Gammaproteobacteria bacterium]|nr:MAG: Na+/H+ antiporter subunit G [Gammaproteobacteria bacterium]
MNALEGLAALLLVAGSSFFLAGTVGLLRFPDALSRLHALTKADNVGLLLICSGLGVLAGSLQTAGMLLLVWLLAMLAATVSAHLIAGRALADDTPELPGEQDDTP